MSEIFKLMTPFHLFADDDLAQLLDREGQVPAGVPPRARRGPDAGNSQIARVTCARRGRGPPGMELEVRRLLLRPGLARTARAFTRPRLGSQWRSRWKINMLTAHSLLNGC